MMTIVCYFFRESCVWVGAHAQSLSHIQLFINPWTVACQAPRSMEFSRQGYWSELPFPFPRDLSNPGIEPVSPVCPALASGFFFFFTTEPPQKPLMENILTPQTEIQDFNCFFFLIFVLNLSSNRTLIKWALVCFLYYKWCNYYVFFYNLQECCKH